MRRYNKIEGLILRLHEVYVGTMYSMMTASLETWWCLSESCSLAAAVAAVVLQLLLLHEFLDKPDPRLLGTSSWCLEAGYCHAGCCRHPLLGSIPYGTKCIRNIRTTILMKNRSLSKRERQRKLAIAIAMQDHRLYIFLLATYVVLSIHILEEYAT